MRDRLLVADTEPAAGKGIDRKERRARIHNLTDTASRAAFPDAHFREPPFAGRVPHDARGLGGVRPRLDADESRTPQNQMREASHMQNASRVARMRE